MPLGVHIVIGLICGVICAVIASSKGRSVIGWFLLGFFFGIIPLIIVACVANLKEQKVYRQRVQSEQHRLREQLRQERLKTEAFRRYTTERLDVHDQTLGVDTRTRQALPSGEAGIEEALRSLAAEHNPRQVGVEAPVWYYEVQGQKNGPVSAVSIKKLLESGQLQGQSLVWTEGLVDWTPARDIRYFRPPETP